MYSENKKILLDSFKKGALLILGGIVLDVINNLNQWGINITIESLFDNKIFIAIVIWVIGSLIISIKSFCKLSNRQKEEIENLNIIIENNNKNQEDFCSDITDNILNYITNIRNTVLKIKDVRISQYDPNNYKLHDYETSNDEKQVYQNFKKYFTDNSTVINNIIGEFLRDNPTFTKRFLGNIGNTPQGTLYLEDKLIKNSLEELCSTLANEVNFNCKEVEIREKNMIVNDFDLLIELFNRINSNQERSLAKNGNLSRSSIGSRLNDQ